MKSSLTTVRSHVILALVALIASPEIFAGAEPITFAKPEKSGGDPAAVLDDSADLKAKSAHPKRFFDNTLVEAVNREYAAKLFPGEMR